DAPVRRGRARGAGAGADGRAAGLDGVSWAEVNAVTGNVLIAYAEREVHLGTLVDTVRDVAEAHRAARADPAMHACPPDDEAERAAAGAALVSRTARRAARDGRDSGLGRFFGCTPLGPAVWTVFLAAAALATLGAAAAPPACFRPVLSPVEA